MKHAYIVSISSLVAWYAFDTQPVLVYTGQKPTIHQVTTMLSTFKSVQFPGHNHLLTTGADDPPL